MLYFQQLSGEKATPNHASVLLGSYFSSSKKKTTTVLLVDELDMLWTTKQSVLYNLFDWPSMSHSHLVVLAVANTMDLPERVLLQKISSRMVSNGVAPLDIGPGLREKERQPLYKGHSSLCLYIYIIPRGL